MVDLHMVANNAHKKHQVRHTVITQDQDND